MIPSKLERFCISQKSNGIRVRTEIKIQKFLLASNLFPTHPAFRQTAEVGKDSLSEICWWTSVGIRRNYPKRQRHMSTEREPKARWDHCLARSGTDMACGHLSIVDTEVFTF